MREIAVKWATLKMQALACFIIESQAQQHDQNPHARQVKSKLNNDLLSSNKGNITRKPKTKMQAPRMQRDFFKNALLKQGITRQIKKKITIIYPIMICCFRLKQITRKYDLKWLSFGQDLTFAPVQLLKCPYSLTSQRCGAQRRVQDIVSQWGIF